MMSCFMFGHADTPQSVLPQLDRAIESVIASGIRIFYVGYHGNFDHLAASALRAAKRKHPDIVVQLLLSYHPAERPMEAPQGFDGTFYPPLETVPRRYAIAHANQHMVKTSDSIVCYVKHMGNTRKLLECALWRQKKEDILIVNVADAKP